MNKFKNFIQLHNSYLWGKGNCGQKTANLTF